MTEQFGKFSPEVGIGLGRSEIIDRLYDVAVDPDRFEDLVDSWERCIGPFRRIHAKGHVVQFYDPELEAHFDRATILLDRLPQDSTDTAHEILSSIAQRLSVQTEVCDVLLSQVGEREQERRAQQHTQQNLFMVG